jgi:hypothetical protein
VSRAEIGLVAQETEVSSKPRRRRFTAGYNRKIFEEVAACTKPGEIGALLRREGLYSSNLSEWRRAQQRGALAALAPKKWGPAANGQPAGTQGSRARARARARDTAGRARRGPRRSSKIVSELLGIQLPKQDEES